MHIQPIETKYNGYRFRSRLEARWAVFFDAAGIMYTYEPEGFRLADGSWYLPDFYLPWFHAYVEIKPKGFAGRAEAMHKLELLFQHDGVVCLYCEGDPYECIMQIYCNELNDGGGGIVWEPAEFVEGAWFSRIPGDESYDYGYTKHWVCILVSNEDDKRERTYSDSSYNDVFLCQRSKFVSCRSDFTDCKLKARQARFEHSTSQKEGHYAG